jgi:uncharacterized DUF497 family protein
MGLKVEWDEDKARSNARKHGVTFEEAVTVFSDVLAMTIHDGDHSDDEDRYVIMGETDQQRLLVVSFTDREDAIRIISARVANRRERKKYEEGS